MTATVLLFALGAGMLVLGADLLVAGASRLAAAAGITPLVIGLTVVAFGTSAPELVVSAGSVLAGRGDIAVGNVVGSNIFNVLFILGVSALITPLVVNQQLVRLDVPLMIAASGLTWALAADGVLGRADGALLLGGIVAYTAFLIRTGGREAVEVRREYEAAFGGEERRRGPWRAAVLRVLGGLALLVVGAHWVVEAAAAIAHALGASELVIGLTVVAVGTSLPEVATSVAAAFRGERDIAVGNVVGSNLFNLLCVLGLASVLAPEGVPVGRGALTFDIPVMTAVAVGALPVFFSGYCIARWKGAVFLAYYVAYATWLVLDATDHPALDELGLAIFGFALPLTLLTLAVVTVRALSAPPRPPPPAPLPRPSPSDRTSR